MLMPFATCSPTSSLRRLSTPRSGTARPTWVMSCQRSVRVTPDSRITSPSGLAMIAACAKAFSCIFSHTSRMTPITMNYDGHGDGRAHGTLERPEQWQHQPLEDEPQHEPEHDGEDHHRAPQVAHRHSPRSGGRNVSG